MTSRQADAVPPLEQAEFVVAAEGLTAAQVAERIAAGRTNALDQRTSRTVGEIVRANVFTVFNGLLITLVAVVVATGKWQNALFGFVVVANSAIGVFQEVRAKRTLDKLALLNAPIARVTREGAEAEIDIADVVLDDLLTLRSGDQVPADARVVNSDGLEIDESVLTGESLPVPKFPGDEARSSSIVVAGSGQAQVTAVGAHAYAAKIAAEARRFQLTHSELMAGTNKLLRWISLMIVVIGPIMVWSQFRSDDNDGWQEAVTGAVAAVVGMIPEGLVLLTSLAFMIATITLARKQTLVQELPAVEVLARVDVVCLDKTGTLTHGDPQFESIELLDGADESDVCQALGLLCHGTDANATALALRERFPKSAWLMTESTPFSSARKWSSVTVNDKGTWIFGAPEMIVPHPADPVEHDVRRNADEQAEAGSRVLLLAAADTPPVDGALPPSVRPVALVMLGEHIRADAPDTLRFFAEQGVALKVISGDNPKTVGSVAARVGLPNAKGLDARTLPEDLDELGEVMANNNVFGRVTPHQKRAIVAALQKRGHVVAMTGDGVNDALALKDADIGVAMGNGAAATRAVAQLVLLDSRFSHLPDVVAEGRRVIANIERAANLFLVKNVYSLVLALIVAFTAVAYPLEPIQLTLISNLTIGVPAFFLALGPNTRRYIPGFLTRVLQFSVPTGLLIGLSAYGAYEWIRHVDHGGGVTAARTAATLAIVTVSLWTLSILARPLKTWKLALVAVMVAAVIFIIVTPLAKDVFLLEITSERLLTGLAVGAVGATLVELVTRLRRSNPLTAS